MLIHVLAILKAIDENRPIPSDEATWLKQGFIRCMKNGELMHHALNLTSLRHQYLLRTRNKHLYAAWCLTDESSSNSKRAAEIITKIKFFR
mgnify:CR=1 FL=1